MSNNFLLRQFLQVGRIFSVGASIAIGILGNTVLNSSPALANNHSTVSGVKASSVTKPLASGSVSRGNLLIAGASGTSGTQPVINYAKNYYGTVSSPAFINAIKNIANKGYSISRIAFTPQGGFVIIYRVNNFTFLPNFGASYNNIPQEAANELTYLASQPAGDNVDDIAFAPQGGFVIVHNVGRYCYISSDTPPVLSNKIKTVFKGSQLVSKVAFTPQGGVVFLDHDNNFFYSNDIPQAVRDEFTALHNIGDTINSLAFTPQDGLAATTLSATAPYYYVNIPQALAD